MNVIPALSCDQFAYAAVDIVHLGACAVHSVPVPVPVRVTGYLCRGSITLYVRRDCRDGWRVELSHGSGGRDTEDVADDLFAAANFGCALVAASALGSMIR